MGAGKHAGGGRRTGISAGTFTQSPLGGLAGPPLKSSKDGITPIVGVAAAS
jgi:hypothetical protein